MHHPLPVAGDLARDVGGDEQVGLAPEGAFGRQGLLLEDVQGRPADPPFPQGPEESRLIHQAGPDPR